MSTAATELEATRSSVEYAAMMLEATCKAVADLPSGAVRNAVLESFVAHARTLIPFLFFERDTLDSPTARSFDPLWPEIRAGALGQPPGIIADMYPLLENTPAHAWCSRLNAQPEQVVWETVLMHDAIKSSLDLFRETAGWTKPSLEPAASCSRAQDNLAI